MIKLTPRLQMMADLVKPGERVADIGTDHGMLPLHLWERGISPKVILCDISEPSLAKSIDAASEYTPCDTIAFRAGDGLKVLERGEVDTIVIAGMGGKLITEILACDMDKTLSFGRYILQPRNNSGALRYWLASMGFNITDNLLVREGRFICEIVVAEAPDGKREKPFSESDERKLFGEVEDACREFPPDMLKTQPELAGEYLDIKLGRERKIFRGLMEGKNVDSHRILLVKERIEYFERLKKGVE